MKTSHIHLQISDKSLQKHQIKSHIVSTINKVLQLFAYFSTNNEPRIWITADRDGKLYWHAYDPVSDTRVCLDSEAELRIWLEQRYYR